MVGSQNTSMVALASPLARKRKVAKAEMPRNGRAVAATSSIGTSSTASSSEKTTLATLHKDIHPPSRAVVATSLISRSSIASSPQNTSLATVHKDIRPPLALVARAQSRSSCSSQSYSEDCFEQVASDSEQEEQKQPLKQQTISQSPAQQLDHILLASQKPQLQIVQQPPQPTRHTAFEVNRQKMQHAQELNSSGALGVDALNSEASQSWFEINRQKTQHAQELNSSGALGVDALKSEASQSWHCASLLKATSRISCLEVELDRYARSTDALNKKFAESPEQIVRRLLQPHKTEVEKLKLDVGQLQSEFMSIFDITLSRVDRLSVELDDLKRQRMGSAIGSPEKEMDPAAIVESLREHFVQELSTRAGALELKQLIKDHRDLSKCVSEKADASGLQRLHAQLEATSSSVLLRAEDCKVKLDLQLKELQGLLSNKACRSEVNQLSAMSKFSEQAVERISERFSNVITSAQFEQLEREHRKLAGEFAKLHAERSAEIAGMASMPFSTTLVRLRDEVAKLATEVPKQETELVQLRADKAELSEVSQLKYELADKADISEVSQLKCDLAAQRDLQLAAQRDLCDDIACLSTELSKQKKNLCYDIAHLSAEVSEQKTERAELDMAFAKKADADDVKQLRCDLQIWCSNYVNDRDVSKQRRSVRHEVQRPASARVRNYGYASSRY